jgi:hypothetical protein
VLPISQSSEELTLYNLVENMTITNPGLKAVSSNLLVERFVFFFFLLFFYGVDDWGFVKEKVKTRPI